MNRQSKELEDRVIELKYDDHIKSMPEQPMRVIKHKWFYFKYPKFWWDDRKILYVTKVFRTFACLVLFMSLALTATSLVVNDKKREWDLHTFDQDGIVRWVSEIVKRQ